MASTGVSQVGRFDYIPTLDGWRAVSVLGVISYHCAANGGLWPGSMLSRLALRCDIGVDIFFAISGFLIGGKLLQECREKGTISWKSFYLRRCFRIIPALWFYLAILGILTAIGWIATFPWEFGSALTFTRNYFPLYDGHVLGQYTGQLWSLGVEEHFYLLWAVIMLCFGPKISRIGWATLILALSVYVWRSIDSVYGWWIPFGSSVGSKTDTRIDALLWGCLAAIVYPALQTRLKRSTLRYAIWVVIGLVAATIDLQFIEFSLIRAILLPVMLLTTALCPTSMVSRFLELPAIRWIGRISYSMYIWQQLATFPAAGVHSPLLVIQHLPYNIPVIFVLAAISYYFVELPMIRLGRRVARSANNGKAPSRRSLAAPQTVTVES